MEISKESLIELIDGLQRQRENLIKILHEKYPDSITPTSTQPEETETGERQPDDEVWTPDSTGHISQSDVYSTT